MMAIFSWQVSWLNGFQSQVFGEYQTMFIFILVSAYNHIFELTIFGDISRLNEVSRIVTKPTKWHVHPAKIRISLGICSVWSVFAVRLKKAWVLSYPLSAQRRLIRLGGCPGWSESSLGAQSFCWFCHGAAQVILFCFSFLLFGLSHRYSYDVAQFSYMGVLRLFMVLIIKNVLNNI